jgi:quinol monooxygenase YgiN
MKIGMSHGLFVFVFALAGVTGCSSSSDGGAQPANAQPVTVLVTGTLSGDEAASKSLHESVVSSSMAMAKASGDTGHEPLLSRDTPAGAPLSFLGIDRWSSEGAFDAFVATPAFGTFTQKFYAASPDVSFWLPRDGWTTWGSPADEAPSAGGYAITLRGRHAGDDATAMATHNGIVAQVPAPGPVGLGNIAHLVYANPNDSGELLLLEVWTNQMAQEAAYKQLGAATAMLWAAPPTITRWNTTDWTRW